MHKFNPLKILIPVASILLIAVIGAGAFIFYEENVTTPDTSKNKALASKYSNCSGLLNGGWGMSQTGLIGLDKKSGLIKLKAETTMLTGTKIKPNGEYTIQDATSSSILKVGQLIDFQGNLVLDQNCTEYINGLDLSNLK